MFIIIIIPKSVSYMQKYLKWLWRKWKSIHMHILKQWVQQGLKLSRKRREDTG